MGTSRSFHATLTCRWDKLWWIFAPRYIRGNPPVKRLLALTLAATLVAAAVAFSGGQKPTGGELDIRVEDRNPWTHLRFNNSPSEFRFAIVSDRTGGHRARLFSQPVDRLNL